MRCLVLGDTHIEGLNSLFGEKGVDFSLWAWEYAISYCLENSIKTLIQVGDVFDTPYPSQKSQRRLLSLLCKSGLDIYIILGNHDYDIDSNGLELTQWVSSITNGPKVISEPTLLKVEDELCWFSPYPHNKEPKKKALCFGHFDVPGFKRDNGFKIKGRNENLKQKWILGHIHTFQSKKNIVYVGTPYQTNFGEKAKKFMLDVTYYNGKLDWDAVPVKPPFELSTVVVERQSDLDFKIEKNTFYKVCVKSSVKIPDTYLQDRPQILKFEGFSSKEQLYTSVGEEVGIKVDPTYKLKDFLKSKGYKDKDIKRAIKIVKKEIGNV